jgi:hypothetical protein
MAKIEAKLAEMGLVLPQALQRWDTCSLGSRHGAAVECAR